MFALLGLLGCTQLGGFGLATDAVFAVFPTDDGFAAYGQVRAVRQGCVSASSAPGGDGDLDALCAGIAVVGAEGAEFAGSTTEFDVLSYWFPPEPSLEDLVGAVAGGVIEAPCTGNSDDFTFEEREAHATIESIDDTVVVVFDGDVRGRVRAPLCE